MSAKILLGSVRCAWILQLRSSSGGLLALMSSSTVGWRPVGRRKCEEKVSESGWCRAGKEKSVGDGLVSSPTTVKKPPRESSSSRNAFSTDSIPTSSLELPGAWLSRCRSWVVGGKKALKTKAWEMVSKLMSREEAWERAWTRARQAVCIAGEDEDEDREGHSLCARYVVKSANDGRGE